MLHYYFNFILHNKLLEKKIKYVVFLYFLITSNVSLTLILISKRTCASTVRIVNIYYRRYILLYV